MNQEARNSAAAFIILLISTSSLITALVVISANNTPVTPPDTPVTPPDNSEPHIITKEYLGSFVQQAYIPDLILYDPYGDKSYQKTMIDTDVSFTLKLRGDSETEVNGTVSTGISGGAGSSLSSSPDDVGPGKGDTVLGGIYILSWDCYMYHDFDPNTNTTANYYHLELYSSNRFGTFFLKRGDLASLGISVENRTGWPANYTRFRQVYTGSPVDRYFNYTWSGTLNTGFSFNVTVSIGGQPVTNVCVTYSIVCSTPQTIHCVAHYEDRSYGLLFYEAADDAIPSLDTVFSYALWYNPG